MSRKKERLYLVHETCKVHGTAEVWATSKKEAIAKVKAASGTADAYEFWYEPGESGPLTAQLERTRDGLIDSRTIEPRS